MITTVSESVFAYSAVAHPDKVEIQAEYLFRDPDGRCNYRVHVRDAEGHHYLTDDLRSGVGAPIDARRAWATAVSFLSAAREAQGYGDDAENADLFPRWVIDLLGGALDAFDIHAMEIELGD